MRKCNLKELFYEGPSVITFETNRVSIGFFQRKGLWPKNNITAMSYPTGYCFKLAP